LHQTPKAGWSNVVQSLLLRAAVAAAIWCDVLAIEDQAVRYATP
jgi:hypothetical protein